MAQADRYLRDGRAAEAVETYSSVLARAPDRADAWFNLAWAQRAERRFEDALASYAQALAHGIAQPEEALLNRAVILSEFLLRSEEALEELRRAIEANPDFVPAWLNLANVHEDLGQIEEAKAAYARVLVLDPANGRAYARLGAIDIFAGDAAKAAADLDTALAKVESLDGRADMLFSLGTALDALEDYSAAFQAYEAANWIARAIAPAGYDAAGQEQMVDDIIHAYPTAQPHREEPAEAAQPIFVCGMFRSGSTLVEQILGRHHAVTAAGELDAIPAMARRLLPYPQAAAAVTREEIDALRAEYLRALPGIGTVTDKRCDNFLHIGLIKTLFPEAKIIHTQRHPLDNLLSVYFLHFGHEISYSHTLPEAAHFYLQYRRLMDHWRQLYGADIHDLDYDRLIADPRATVRELLDFLGLPWDDACLASRLAPGAIRTASVWQARKPLHGRSSGRWRNYESRLDAVRRTLADAGVEG